VGRRAHRPYLVQRRNKKGGSGRLENQAVLSSCDAKFKSGWAHSQINRIATFLHEPVGIDPGVSNPWAVIVDKATPHSDSPCNGLAALRPSNAP
jgi:hypothetical protein